MNEDKYISCVSTKLIIEESNNEDENVNMSTLIIKRKKKMPQDQNKVLKNRPNRIQQ